MPDGQSIGVHEDLMGCLPVARWPFDWSEEEICCPSWLPPARTRVGWRRASLASAPHFFARVGVLMVA